MKKLIMILLLIGVAIQSIAQTKTYHKNGKIINICLLIDTVGEYPAELLELSKIKKYKSGELVKVGKKIETKISKIPILKTEKTEIKNFEKGRKLDPEIISNKSPYYLGIFFIVAFVLISIFLGNYIYKSNFLTKIQAVSYYSILCSALIACFVITFYNSSLDLFMQMLSCGFLATLLFLSKGCRSITFRLSLGPIIGMGLFLVAKAFGAPDDSIYVFPLESLLFLIGTVIISYLLFLIRIKAIKIKSDKALILIPFFVCIVLSSSASNSVAKEVQTEDSCLNFLVYLAIGISILALIFSQINFYLISKNKKNIRKTYSRTRDQRKVR